MTSPAKSVAVIGAGITGLTAAHRLMRAGHRVTVYEASDRIGGCVGSERVDGWLVESGPNSIQDNCPEFTSLVNELGLAERLHEASPAARNRYLLRDGKLLAAPMSPGGFIGTPLLSARAKLRLFGDLFKRPVTRANDVSVADFFRDHFGAEIVDYAVSAMVSGIYAGDANLLSAQHAFPTLWKLEQEHGSLLRGLKASAKAKRAAGGRRGPPRIVSFDDGLAVLTNAITAALPEGAIRLGQRVRSILPGAPCGVITDQGGESHDAIVLAASASGLAQLGIGETGERPLSLLGEIKYPAVTSVFLGYKRDQVKHALDGFGLLAPPIERRAVMGVLFSSTLFPRRAPDGHVGLTVMVGGSLRPDLAAAGDGATLETIRQELAELLGVQGEPVFMRVNRWPAAIPQYNLGYERYQQAMTDFELRHANLYIGGNVRDGVALTSCIAAGERLATLVIAP